MSCDHFQHRFPPEKTFQLYRGLVRDAKNDIHPNNTTSTLARNERERMRVLELLGLTETKVPSDAISSKNPFVDKPSYHLGSNARQRGVTKDRKQHSQWKTTQSSQKRHTESQTPLSFQQSKIRSQRYGKKQKRGLRSSHEFKQNTKTLSDKHKHKSPKFNATKNVEYIWHPLENQKSSHHGNGKLRSRANKGVLSYYHNQYHKQTK